MKFCNELENYLNQFNCTAKDLSDVSNLSQTLISRYINDKRTPRINSIQFNQIIDGLYTLSLNNNKPIEKSEINHTLSQSISDSSIDFNVFIDNFNTLITDLNLNLTELSNYIGYDTSFISRIRIKDRKPAELNTFIEKFSDFIINKFPSNGEKQKVLNIIKTPEVMTATDKYYKDTLIRWCTTSHTSSKNLVKSFLVNLDTFDLNEYIGKDFNKVKAPTVPVIFKNSKTFYGSEGRKIAEAEFLKTTLLSKSKEPIFFYSDLPMSEASQDEDFKNKWILAITMVLKRGLHLNIIHDINRPLEEMLLGLESWIPIYMTGSISPYYFNEHPSHLMLGSHCTSGSVALTGEFLNKPANSKFYLTTKKDELDYYKEKSAYLLSKAKPLMTIFKENEEEKFKEFLNKEQNKNTYQINKQVFKNINFVINPNKWVMINKTTSPQIHFVIHNYKLRKAVETFLSEQD